MAEISITTDVTKLTQVITNLLSNAIKFSENNFVDIGFNLKSQWIEFMIKDMGVGISPEHHQLIFDRFWQVRSHSKQNVEGMGLGLSISKSMVEQMGGKIWLESQPGKGTTFYFRIPFEPATVRDSTQDAGHKKIDYRKCFEKKCILIAEDEDINFKYLRTILEKAGANVIHAKNGETAVIATMTHVPDLVLMDMKMPVMNGIDATRIIRKRFPKMPIIAITAFTMEHDKEKTMQAGCDNYIPKPINEGEFFKTVGSYLMK